MLTSMMNIKNPCVLDCPDRNGECHATCEKYAAYEAAKQEIYKQRDIERDKNIENHARTIARKKGDRAIKVNRRHYR